MSVKSRVSPKLAVDFNIPNGNSQGRLFSRLSRAASFLEQHNPKQALRLLSHVSPASLPSLSRAEWYEVLATSAQVSGQFSLAYESFRRALKEYSQLRDRIGVAQTLLHLGDVCRQMEKFQEARSYYARVSAEKNSHLRIEALCGDAMSLRGLGLWNKSLSGFKKYLSFFEKNRDPEGVAYALWAMGTTERFAGSFKSAKQHLTQSVAIYQRLGNKSGWAYAMAGLGGTLRMMGLPGPSGRLYARAHGVFRRFHDDFGRAYTYCGQGNALRMQNKVSQALPYMNKAIRLYQKLGMKGPLGFVLWSRAQARILQGQFSAAKKDLSHSERLFKQVRDPRGLTYVDLGWGEYWKNRNKTKSDFYFRKSATRAKKFHLPFEQAHALVRYNRADFSTVFRRRNVVLPAFRKYRSIP